MASQLTGLPRSRQKRLLRGTRQRRGSARRGWRRPEAREATMVRSQREQKAKEVEQGAPTISPNMFHWEEAARMLPSSGTLSPTSLQSWRPRRQPKPISWRKQKINIKWWLRWGGSDGGEPRKFRRLQFKQDVLWLNCTAIIEIPFYHNLNLYFPMIPLAPSIVKPSSD